MQVHRLTVVPQQLLLTPQLDTGGGGARYTGRLHIAARYWVGGGGYKGRLDEVRWYTVQAARYYGDSQRCLVKGSLMMMMLIGVFGHIE